MLYTITPSSTATPASQPFTLTPIERHDLLHAPTFSQATLIRITQLPQPGENMLPDLITDDSIIQSPVSPYPARLQRGPVRFKPSQQTHSVRLRSRRRAQKRTAHISEERGLRTNERIQTLPLCLWCESLQHRPRTRWSAAGNPCFVDVWPVTVGKKSRWPQEREQK